MKFKLGMTVEEMRDTAIDSWIKETKSNGKMFAFWCMVSAAFRTGLCAKCLSEDSCLNEACSCRSKPRKER